MEKQVINLKQVWDRLNAKVPKAYKTVDFKCTHNGLCSILLYSDLYGHCESDTVEGAFDKLELLMGEKETQCNVFEMTLESDPDETSDPTDPKEPELPFAHTLEPAPPVPNSKFGYTEDLPF